jgi:hypothetical protein
MGENKPITANMMHSEVRVTDQAWTEFNSE